MAALKNSLLRRQKLISNDRNIDLKNPSKVKSVLIVTNDENQSLKRRVEELFDAASIYHLFIRPIKEDRTVGFYYSVHDSDFNLTGKLKNDKLINLLAMSIDLLIDLSAETELLEYFVKRSSASLKVGNLKSKDNETYDLMCPFGQTDKETIENIFAHLNNLTKHAS